MEIYSILILLISMALFEKKVDKFNVLYWQYFFRLSKIKFMNESNQSSECYLLLDDGFGNELGHCLSFSFSCVTDFFENEFFESRLS